MIYVGYNLSSPRPRPDLFSEAYLVLGNAFLVFALLTVSIVYADSRREKIKADTRAEERTSGILRHLDSIFHTRTGLSAYLLHHQINEEELATCVIKSSEYLQFVADETRSMFEDYTNHICGVSIKLLVPGAEGSPEIRTYLRDKKSDLARRGLYPPKGTYPYQNHSPFVDIVTGQTKDDFFISNDLRSLAKEGRYENGNPHWAKLYNSTVIVPIKEPSTISSENILGFLCVDSLGAKFDQAVSVYMARIVANTVFYVISNLSLLESRAPSNNITPRSADAR
jgi:hypothetical protein